MSTGDDADGLHVPSVSLSEHGKKESKRKRAAKSSLDESIILLQSLRDLVQKSQAGEKCAKGSAKWEHISQELSRCGCGPRAATSVGERWDTLHRAYLHVEDYLRAGKDFVEALHESRKEFKFLPAEYAHKRHALAAGCGPTHKKNQKNSGAELASVKKTPAKEKLIDATPCASDSLETFTQAFREHIRSVASLLSRSRDPPSASQRCDETDEPGDIVRSLLSIIEAVETCAKFKKSEVYYSLEIDKREWKLVQDRASSLLEDHMLRSRPTPRDADSNLEQALERFQGLVYPQNDPDALTITQEDMRTLNPSEFLNGTIIDFYNKYLLQTLVSRERLHTLHVFNNFFFPMLAGIDTNYKVQSRVAFERVKNWTVKIAIFEKDYIFIPVNQRSHWSLIIICHPGRICNADGPFGVSDVGDPCILHLDSYEGYHTGLEDCIKMYLSEEWKERNLDADAREYFAETHFISAKVPQQDNDYDCGIFMLHYLELFLKVAPPKFSLRSIRNKDPNFLRKDWFKPFEASTKRPLIQQLIISISQGTSATSLKNAQEPSNFEANGELARTSLECEHDTHKNGSDLFLGPQTRERTTSQEASHKEILLDMQAQITRLEMLVGSGRKTLSETCHGEVRPSMPQYVASTSGPHDTSLQIQSTLITDPKKCQTTKIALPYKVQGDMLYYIHQGDSLLLRIAVKNRSTFYMLKDFMHGTRTLGSSWQILCKGVNTPHGCQDCKDGKDGMRIVEATTTNFVICDVLNSKIKPENFKIWSPLRIIEHNDKDEISDILLHPNLNIVFWATTYGVVGACDFQNKKLIGRVHLPQPSHGAKKLRTRVRFFSITRNMLMVTSTVNNKQDLFTWTLNDEQVKRVNGFANYNICDLHNDQVQLLVEDTYCLAIYDLQQRKELHRYTSPDRIYQAKYSCDSQLVYAAFLDECIGIFDATYLRLHCRITLSAYNLNKNPYIWEIVVHPQKCNQFAILSRIDECIYVIEPSDELGGEWVCKASLRS